MARPRSGSAKSNRQYVNLGAVRKSVRYWLENPKSYDEPPMLTVLHSFECSVGQVAALLHVSGVRATQLIRGGREGQARFRVAAAELLGITTDAYLDLEAAAAAPVVEQPPAEVNETQADEG